MRLTAAGVDQLLPFDGLTAGCPVQRPLLDGLVLLDAGLQTIVLKCTNLPPFAADLAADIASITRRQVRHLIDLVGERRVAAL
jgi:hypothetical protein